MDTKHHKGIQDETRMVGIAEQEGEDSRDGVGRMDRKNNERTKKITKEFKMLIFEIFIFILLNLAGGLNLFLFFHPIGPNEFLWLRVFNLGAGIYACGIGFCVLIDAIRKHR